MTMRRWGATDCARAVRWIYPALDGDLGALEAAALASHLEVCGACRALRDREAAFRSELARLCATPPAAPAALHARLRAALAPRPVVTAPAQPPAGASGRSRRVVGAAAAVIAVAGVGLGLVLGEPLVRTRSATPALVRSVAAQQAALAEGRLPLELADASSGSVAAWLRPRLGFPVELPPLVGEDVEVVGARLTELAATDAAAVLSRVDGCEVTLFTFPAAVLAAPESRGGGSTELVVDGHRFRHYRLDGMTVTLWARGRVGYALAAPADLTASRGCAVCHLGEDNKRLERQLAPGLGR
jgi:anti-sigma factor (TIGR02949 family)